MAKQRLNTLTEPIVTDDGDNDICQRAIDTYAVNTQAYLQRYESVRFEEVHANILDLIPRAPTRVLDVGAGSGRDAAALAKMGHDVLAVEPCAAMHLAAQSLHGEPNIAWIDDCLPYLNVVKKMGLKFGFILLSAVWMHLPQETRPKAFESLVNLLDKGGRLAITLRLGKPDPKRWIFPVNEEELKDLGEEFGLALLKISGVEDKLQRSDVTWKTVVFEK